MTIKPDMFLPELLSIEKPARYFGNEAGSVQKTAYQVRITLCFPDIYEIGMCNNAMRILYSKINEQTDIFCDRVFAPKPDFGNLLTMKKISLFGLDSHEEIKKSDILGFSIGYELLATNVLYVLDLAGISPLRSQRSDNDPIIIAGGPGITNPAPFIDFFDAVWIGEAETEFFDFLEQFKVKKQHGHGKNELLTLIHEHSSFYDGADKPVSRNVHYHFGDTYQKLNFPVPCVRPVQEHAVVEIMRGCINGCRFCQAGYTYRPARIKNPNIIIAEVEDRVRAGYTTISLSSLSSGDYPNVLELLALLTEKYRGKNISFQLPSLKVESFDLEILQHISELKKSGLTFAIETARSEWQKQINKIVDKQKVYSILEQAKKYHFKTAKFYFMLGLPISGTLEEEAEAIIDFLKTILKTTTMEIHVTISMFVPKPHTPYENAQLANPIDVLEAIYTIKDNFKHKKQLKISYHNPYMAYLEYVIAHGTKNLSCFIMEAYKAGCVFDAWDDHFNKEQWLKILSTWTIPIGNELYKKIHMKVSGAYLKNEYSKSEQYMLTNTCTPDCEHPCSACTDQTKIYSPNQYKDEIEKLSNNAAQAETIPAVGTAILKSAILFSYSKTGTAAFIPHHDLSRIFETAFNQIGISIAYSKGFHPMPKIEISEPLPLGIQSLEEYGLLYIESANTITPEVGKLQTYLPLDLKMLHTVLLHEQEAKYQSLSQLMNASVFTVEPLERTADLRKSITKLYEYCIERKINAELCEPGVVITTNTESRRIQVLLETCFNMPWRDLPFKLTRSRQLCKNEDKSVTPFSLYPVKVHNYC